MCLQGRLPRKKKKKQQEKAWRYLSNSTLSTAASMPDTKMSLHAVGRRGDIDMDHAELREINCLQRWVCSMLDIWEEHLGQKIQNSQNSCKFSTDFSFYKSKPGQMRLQKIQDGPSLFSLFPSCLQTELSSTFLDTHHELDSRIESTSRIVGTGYGKAQLYSVSLYPARISIIFSKINLRNKTQCLKASTNESK